MNKKYILLVASLLLVSLLPTGCIETGKGTAVDTIYDVSDNGIIWKTNIVYLTNDHPSKGKESSYSAIYTVGDFLSRLQDRSFLIR
jgi:predicted small secreted protein